jgi:hypothetical protein
VAASEVVPSVREEQGLPIRDVTPAVEVSIPERQQVAEPEVEASTLVVEQQLPVFAVQASAPEERGPRP